MPDTSTPSSSPDSKRHWLWAGFAAATAAVLSACGVKTTAPTSRGDGTASSGDRKISNASSAKIYRQDAARHIYAHNSHRIFQGSMPPLLYAIGTLQVHLDTQGNVSTLDWMRAPSHAPEVIREIERTVHAAAPYPVAQRIGAVVYTDTWLWHKSGRFQLDTLTEGQRDRSS